MRKVQFTVPGKPMGKQRPKFGNGYAYTPKQTKEYEELVRLTYSGKLFLEGTIEAQITAYYAIPKSISKAKKLALKSSKCTNRPDSDNIAKIILDALNGLAYDDDSQVTDLVVHKRYADEPRVEVVLTETEEG